MSAEPLRVHVSRYAHLDGLEVLVAHGLQDGFDRHMHEEYSIALIERGPAGNRLRGANWRAPAESVVLMEPEEIHTGFPASSASISYRMMYVPTATMIALARDAGHTQQPRFVEPILYDTAVVAALRRFHRALDLAAPHIEQQYAFHAAIKALIGEMRASAPREGSREPRRIAALVEYLETHLDQNVSLQELAALAGVSADHLIRMFASATGAPPHAYLNALRMQRARALLRSGAGVADVASRVGLSDQSHLTRRFRRAFGVTPARYAQGAGFVQDQSRGA